MVKIFFLFLVEIFTFTSVFAQTDVIMTEAPPSKDMQMRIELSHDTVTFGQEFYISLIFENLSDSSIMFYPKGILIMTNADFGRDFFLPTPFYFLNLIQNSDLTRLVQPKSSTKDIYTVITTDFFSKGENVLCVAYIFKCQNKEQRTKNKEEKRRKIVQKLTYIDAMSLLILKFT